MLAGRDGFEITLFHVCSVPPRLLEHEGAEDPGEEERLEEALEAEFLDWRKAKHSEVQREVFQGALRLLREAGVDERHTRLTTRFVTEPHADVVSQILQELDQHDHDIIALGRHGGSALTDLLFARMVSRVVHHAKGRAIWIVE